MFLYTLVCLSPAFYVLRMWPACNVSAYTLEKILPAIFNQIKAIDLVMLVKLEKQEICWWIGNFVVWNSYDIFCETSRRTTLGASNFAHS